MGLGVLILLAPSGTPPPAPSNAYASSLPSGFTETTAFSGLTNPTVVRFATDGRVFVAEKCGPDQGVRQPVRHDADDLRRPDARTSTTSGTAACSGWRSIRTSRRSRTSTSCTRYDAGLVGGIGAEVGHTGVYATRARRPPGADDRRLRRERRASRGSRRRRQRDDRRRAGARRGLVPAVPEPLDRHRRVRPRRRAVRERRATARASTYVDYGQDGNPRTRAAIRRTRRRRR